MARAVLAIRDAVVRYGETTALDGVSLDVMPGEVHSLIGENGAGKSTLLRALAGVTHLDAGGIDCAAGTYSEWVPQDLTLAPDLTVTEAIFLAREIRARWRRLDRATMQRETRMALAEVGCPASPVARIGELSAPVRKQVQLARGFHACKNVLLLDEPTAVLGRDAITALFGAIRRVRAQGTGIVYVSHQIDEVLAIADRVSVLRDGRRVSTDPIGAIDTSTIVTRMVGRPLLTPASRAARSNVIRSQTPVLSLQELYSGSLRHITFEVAAREIVGLAGLVGAGRSELLEIVAGLRTATGGSLTVRGTTTLVPEDRAQNGLIPTFSLRENVFLPAPSRWLHGIRERVETSEWIERLRIRTRGPDVLPATLSGGNQQKVLLARALRRAPNLLLLDEPTAGVDVGAKVDIHRIVRELAAAGTAVVIASSELPELLALCDRVVALRNGEQAGVLSAHDADERRLAALITGAPTESVKGEYSS